MTNDRSLVELNNVSKRFGAVTAVDGISLELRENEFFGLLGPSGCGKTTLLRLLAGFEVPDEGEILLAGRDLVQVRPNKRPVNMMFQSYALFPHLSVRKNIAYGLKMDKVPRREIEQRVGEALEMVQLTQEAGRKPEELSGGQRQRVALARALIKRPRLLLLDEPLAALDRKLRQQMQFELKRLQQEVGITFMVVTHDQEEALAMADRIALLKAGRIAQFGSARNLYEQPTSYFVADFIGAMNFFEGRIGSTGMDADGIGLLYGRRHDLGPGERAWMAVRPEKIKLYESRPVNDAKLNVIHGRLAGTTYMGQDISCYVQISNREGPILVRLSSDNAGEICMNEGAEVWCAWPASASHILKHASKEHGNG